MFVFVVEELIRMLIISDCWDFLSIHKIYFIAVAKCGCSLFHGTFLDVIEGIFGQRRRSRSKSDSFRKGVELFGRGFVEGRAGSMEVFC